MSLAYRPPLADLRFVIEDVLDAPAHWAACPAFAEVDAQLAGEVLEQAGRFAADMLAPLNASGDLQGCALHEGRVRTPDGFAQAYRAFVEGGWPALACDQAFGGQGLPGLLNVALYEMLDAANHAWAMYPGLAHGAYECLKRHASDALRDQWLPGIVSGEVLATMCLTEPQAGSDLGLLRTRAEPQVDGSVRVTGQKIFISGGEQDFTPQILHLVLCRLPGAPTGTKGLSLVLVPKRLANGEPNAVHCDALEKKMGIKGSATCAIRLEGATGWLLGEPNQGLAAMFAMMNSARLQVGVQGLAHLEAARQAAWQYASERVQGRTVGSGSQPIAQHPAVRRLLWTLQSLADGARVIALHAARLIDDAEHHPDSDRRRSAGAQAELLTPVVKAFLTALGHRGANDALQVLGGHGYVHDFGIEQHVRDSRIALIYEGTNEIQAIDLVTRKLPNHQRALQALFAECGEEARRCCGEAGLAAFGHALQAQVAALARAVERLGSGEVERPELGLELADDLLTAFGWMLMAWAWTRQARAAGRLRDDRERRRRVASAAFGIEWLLPEAETAHRRLASDAELPQAGLVPSL